MQWDGYRFIPIMFSRISIIVRFVGILPPHQGSHDFVMKQRKQQYADLHEALVAMQRVTTSTHQSEVFLKMFLVEEGLLPFEETKMVITTV